MQGNVSLTSETMNIDDYIESDNTIYELICKAQATAYNPMNIHDFIDRNNTFYKSLCKVQDTVYNYIIVIIGKHLNVHAVTSYNEPIDISICSIDHELKFKSAIHNEDNSLLPYLLFELQLHLRVPLKYITNCDIFKNPAFYTANIELMYNQESDTLFVRQTLADNEIFDYDLSDDYAFVNIYNLIFNRLEYDIYDSHKKYIAKKR